MQGMKLVFGVMAIVLALVCYAVFGQFLVHVAGLDWAGVPRELMKRPADSAIGFGIPIFGTVLLAIGAGFLGRNDR